VSDVYDTFEMKTSNI